MKKSELKSLIREVAKEDEINLLLKRRLVENVSHKDEMREIEIELQSSPNDKQLKAIHKAKKFITNYVNQSAKTN